MATNRTIIIFENGELKCCEKGSCEGCAEFENCPKANKSQYEEISELCKSEKYNFALNCNNSTVKANRYTGYFELLDGTVVEILPKIHKNSKDCYSKDCIGKSLEIFKNLLMASSDITKDVKEGTLTSTEGGKLKLFEILISIFSQKVQELVKKGLKKFYQTREENLPYLKGKIKFSEHIKRNIVSKEKFYVEYDDFIEDIAENRILKSACRYALSQTISPENKKILRRCIVEFEQVGECYDLERDLSEITDNKLFKYYENPLMYAEFLLRKKNFVPNKGKNKLPALFFPLNKMFEDYVKILLEGFKNEIKYDFKAQPKEKHLLYKETNKEKTKIFLTIPDFIVKKDKTAFILDAKYKVVNISDDLNKLNDEVEEEKNYYNNTGVSQSDLYQVFAYSEIMKQSDNKVQVALLYPKNENFKDFKEETEYFYFNGTKITFIPIDLTGEKSKWLDKNDTFKKYLKNLK